MRFFAAILGAFECALGAHQWTSPQEQGVPFDVERHRVTPALYFWQYVTPYCARCGKRLDVRTWQPKGTR